MAEETTTIGDTASAQIVSPSTTPTGADGPPAVQASTATAVGVASTSNVGGPSAPVGVNVGGTAGDPTTPMPSSSETAAIAALATARGASSNLRSLLHNVSSVGDLDFNAIKTELRKIVAIFDL